MAIVLPRGIIKNYTDERIRRYIMEHAIIIGSIGLGRNVFKPFTNTKTIVLFLQKRFVPLESGQIYELGQSHKKMVFCVTEQSGKDKTGKIITDENNNVVSDFDDIVKFFKENTSFYSEEEYMKMINEESDRDGANDNEII